MSGFTAAMLASATVTGNLYHKQYSAAVTLADDAGKHDLLAEDEVEQFDFHADVLRDVTAGIGGTQIYAPRVTRRFEKGVLLSKAVSLYLDEAVTPTPAGAALAASLVNFFCLLDIEWRDVSDAELDKILRNQMLESG
jgi:hypothetical protein